MVLLGIILYYSLVLTLVIWQEKQTKKEIMGLLETIKIKLINKKNK